MQKIARNRLSNIDLEYFRLNDALFALELFEDGVYHI
jgi:hypothetical protein